MKKTFLSVMLIACLLMGIVPAALAADPVYVCQVGNMKYETVQAGIYAAGNGETVKLLSNAAEKGDGQEGTVLIGDDKNITVDLANYTFTGGFLVKGKATIKNGTISNSWVLSGIENNGASSELIVENVTINTNRHAIRVDGGKATIKSGHFTTVGTSTMHAINISSGAVVEIWDGTFVGARSTGSKEDSSAVAIRDADSKLTIKNGNFSGGVSKTLNFWGGTIIVENGTFIGGDYTMEVSGGANVEFRNGQFPQGVSMNANRLKEILPANYTFYSNGVAQNRNKLMSSVSGNVTIGIAKYTVSFNTNGAGTIADQIITVGGKASKPAEPSLYDNVFGGWYTDSTYTTPYDFNTAVTDDVELFAKWTKNLHVTFHTNCSATLPVVSVQPGKTFAEPAAPSNPGFVLDGWYTDSACTSRFDFRTPVTADMELYALWVAKIELIEGEGQFVKPGKNARFVSNGDYVDFQLVRVDGVEVDPIYYTSESGSTVIVLNASYLSTLPLGTHRIAIVSANGTAAGTFTLLGNPPQTGDSMPIALACMLLAISAAGIVMLSRKRSA